MKEDFSQEKTEKIIIQNLEKDLKNQKLNEVERRIINYMKNN